jgi:hypothetical protein
VERLWRRGETLRDGANAILGKHGFKGVTEFVGDGWWPRLQITSPPIPVNLLVSLWRQEFIANGVFLGASFNLCLAHDDEPTTRQTLAAIENAARDVRAALDSPDPAARLRGEPFQPTFSVR